ncbi:RagB/SusD family nutrient uptake outer membrane protein [Parabacteroides timonensis]|uniref:RagB/SusD family nutrient uptake outer membrane protein n=1 Tax=Parabacteroides timonensis TaxID=1871013 RepID=UPI00094E2296|nr:RagB/SusD family nutrient uptake outer membrane protein [Parabacteroides timonensis]
MKTYLKTAVAVLCVGGLISSCSNNLDEKVYSLVTEETYNYSTEDFHPTVASVYSYLRFIGHDNYWATQELTGDCIVNPPNSSGWDDGGTYRMLHYHKWTSEQNHVRVMWEKFYQGVVLCNTVIDQIENGVLPAPSDDEKRKGLAELRAVRAYYNWLICDNFGDAPLLKTRTSELPEKSSRKDIYQFVVDELKEVIPDLDEQQGGNMYGRINKWAGMTLLANVYLNAKVYIGEEHWQDCLDVCDQIITSSPCGLSENYNASFRATGTESSKEILFTIPFDKTLAGGQSIHMFSWHGELQKKFKLEATPWGSGSGMALTQFIDTYDENDTRLTDTWLMGDQYTPEGELLLCTYDMKGQPLSYIKDVKDGNYTNETDGYRMFKFEVPEGTTGSSDTDFPLHRYSEVLLMKAECLLRLGKPGAGDLVTEVRRRNFKNNPEKAVVTDNDLKANSSYQYGTVINYVNQHNGDQSPIEFGRLLDELGWEFAWEMHRRRDLIRFGIYTKKNWLSHDAAGEGDYRTVFPIPEAALTSNPQLTQNPDYASK